MLLNKFDRKKIIQWFGYLDLLESLGKEIFPDFRKKTNEVIMTQSQSYQSTSKIKKY